MASPRRPLQNFAWLCQARRPVLTYDPVRSAPAGFAFLAMLVFRGLRGSRQEVNPMEARGATFYNATVVRESPRRPLQNFAFRAKLLTLAPYEHIMKARVIEWDVRPNAGA